MTQASRRRLPNPRGVQPTMPTYPSIYSLPRKVGESVRVREEYIYLPYAGRVATIASTRKIFDGTTVYLLAEVDELRDFGEQEEWYLSSELEDAQQGEAASLTHRGNERSNAE